MLFSVEQAFVGRDEKRAPLKTPAWEANIDPEKLYCGTFVCQYGLCCCIVWPLFLLDYFVKIWATCKNFLGKWFTAPPGWKLPIRLWADIETCLPDWQVVKKNDLRARLSRMAWLTSCFLLKFLLCLYEAGPFAKILAWTTRTLGSWVSPPSHITHKIFMRKQGMSWTSPVNLTGSSHVRRPF